MHIVNDSKWFTEFHVLNPNINTADNSTTLQIQGFGNVDVLLLNTQQQPIKLRLSDVAYANGRFSTGMNITEQQIKDEPKAICPVFATTRARVRIPRDLAKRQSEAVSDLIHVDV
ncbi:hypothetical protein DL95DRAFT_464356 [Leptodontidium sp. 2 PMI_412]|nr:hypothetical protein DL95DRAFT_464356 [Leptodontidium sp. 2 PMI_412]